jgi:hypothetical protein
VPGIFISYRGEDSEMAVGRLADGLRPHFGKDQVFVDVVTLREDTAGSRFRAGGPGTYRS